MSIGNIREKNLFKNIKDEVLIMKTFDKPNEISERNQSESFRFPNQFPITFEGEVG